MDPQLLINVVSRVLHVSTAIALVGGTVFMAFVLLPAAKQLSDDQHERLSGAVTKVWKRFVHGGILLFLVTGFYNYFQQMPLHKGDGLYHALIGTKMLAAFVLFFLASVLVGRSAAFEGMRKNREKWLKTLVLIAAVIVIISGFIKVRGTKDGMNSNPKISVASPTATDASTEASPAEETAAPPAPASSN